MGDISEREPTVVRVAEHDEGYLYTFFYPPLSDDQRAKVASLYDDRIFDWCDVDPTDGDVELPHTRVGCDPNFTGPVDIVGITHHAVTELRRNSDGHVDSKSVEFDATVRRIGADSVSLFAL